MGFSLGQLNPFANTGINMKLRNTAQTAAVLAGNVYLPGSSLITSQIASKDSQKQLSSDVGKVLQAGTSIYGVGSGGLANYGKGYEAVKASPFGQGVKTIGSGIGSGVKTVAGMMASAPAVQTPAAAPAQDGGAPMPQLVIQQIPEGAQPNYSQAPAPTAPAEKPEPTWKTVLSGAVAAAAIFAALRS